MVNKMVLFFCIVCWLLVSTRLRPRLGWAGRAGWHCGLGWLGWNPKNVKCPRISLGMGSRGLKKLNAPNLIRYGGPGAGTS